jgi:hypothetical protein
MPTAGYPTRYRRVPHGRREFAAFHAECAALVDEATALDEAQRALAVKLATVRTKLAELRVVMWPRVEPKDIVHGFRVTHRGGPPPIPPAAPNAHALWGRHLRSGCLAVLARNGRSMSLVEIHRELHLSGYAIASRHPVKRLADALGYETINGRARRVRRGVYVLGHLNPGERRRIGYIRIAPAREDRRFRHPEPDAPRLVGRFGSQFDAIASASPGLVERAARLVHELGGSEGVRRVARDSGRQRQRITDRRREQRPPYAFGGPDGSRLGRVLEDCPNHQIAETAGGIALAQRAPHDVPDDAERLHLRFAVGFPHRVDLEDDHGDRTQRTSSGGNLLLRQHGEVLLVVEARRSVERLLTARPRLLERGAQLFLRGPPARFLLQNRVDRRKFATHGADLVLSLEQTVLALACPRPEGHPGYRRDNACRPGDDGKCGRIDRNPDCPGAERGNAAARGNDDSRIVHALPHRLTAAPA